MKHILARCFFRMVLAAGLAWFPGYSQLVQAQTLVASFDDLREGHAGMLITDGGISFSNLDRRRQDETPPAYMAIDFVTGLPGPHGSATVLQFGGFIEGPSLSSSHLGSMDIDFDGVASAATVDIFGRWTGFSDGSILMLQATLGNIPVGEDNVSLASGFETAQYRSLSIAGAEFDHLRLSAGPTSDAVVYFFIDNVSISLVPEPEVVPLLALVSLLVVASTWWSRLQAVRNAGNSRTALGQPLKVKPSTVVNVTA